METSGKYSEKSATSFLLGVLGLGIGAVAMSWAGAHTQKSRDLRPIENELGPWKKLKEENSTLYYECLRSVEEP